jgi:hypothetical protein
MRDDIKTCAPRPECLCMLIERKASLVSGYLLISEKMLEEISRGMNDRMEYFISGRFACMTDIKKMDRAIESRMNSEKEQRMCKTDVLRGEFAGRMAIINNLYEKIRAIDAEVTGLVKKECDSIKAKILKMNNAGQAAKGYGTNGKRTPLYFDKRK